MDLVIKSVSYYTGILAGKTEWKRKPGRPRRTLKQSRKLWIGYVWLTMGVASGP
jgi:hypothetical protein